VIFALPNLKLIGVGFLAGALIGFAGAAHLARQRAEAKEAKVAKAQITHLESFIKEDRANYVELDRQDRVQVQVVIKEVEKIREVEKRIPYEVVKYVPSNPACNLSVGAVRLLNDARVLSHPEADRRPAEPLSDAASRAPSDVGQPEEVAAHADCASRYAELAARHNALISLPLAIDKEDRK
jgi:hypothetical protein